MTDTYRASIEALVQRETLAMGRVIHTPGSNLIRQASLLQAPVLPG
jgi:NAD(P)H-quinone oxidoreductase subunit 4